MPSFLDQFLDSGVSIEPGNWDATNETDEQKERLLHELVSIMHAKNMKRRLGPDASPAELSADKKIAKMVYNRLLTIYMTWGGHEADVTELYGEATQFVDIDMIEGSEDEEDVHDLIVAGAQMDWDAFWEAKKAYLKLRVRHVANNAVVNNLRKDGNRMANRFTNEYNSVSDVLDPVDGYREQKFDAI